MQVDQDTAYRLGYETANLELTVIQWAVKKLQQEKTRLEKALAVISLPPVPQCNN